MNDNELIERVKIAKAKGKIKNYYELALLLDMKEKSFYNWLHHYYSMSYQKRFKLNSYLKEIEE